MDDQFDQLSRALAGSLPRRHALKLIAAGAAGMGAAMLGIRPATAEPSRCTCQEKVISEGDTFTPRRTAIWCMQADGRSDCCRQGDNKNSQACHDKDGTPMAKGSPCTCS